MVAACYGSSMVDFWDISAEDGSHRFITATSLPGKPSPGRKHHRPHQAVLDPTGRFFIVPNLGGDTLLVFNDKSYADTHIIRCTEVPVPTGVGPRHVAFLANSGNHYLVMVGELSNELFLFGVEYVDGKLQLNQIQRQSTYGNSPPKDPSVAATAELVVAKNQRDVYVSNRFTGDETDHIAHFVFRGEHGVVRLDYVGRVSSGGLQPRVFSLSADDEQEFVFVGNDTGESGLVALKRDPKRGILAPTPVATMSHTELAAPGLSADKIKGPQFVGEI
ncbi:Lactonase, 7-bladed beta-propeller-domain-containing protein [Hypoxylon sp. FL0890]|nr:Lactonase, 7-bladed beta-propeller-domain-containing protein [Hypoxylon sp. FL0890]